MSDSVPAMQFHSETDPAATHEVLPGDDWYSAAHGWRRWDGQRWVQLADPGDDHPDDGAPRRD